MSTANCSSKTQENTEKKTWLKNACTSLLALRYEFTFVLLLNRGNSFVSMKGSGVCNRDHTSGLPISYFPINYYLCPDFVIMSSSAVWWTTCLREILCDLRDLNITWGCIRMWPLLCPIGVWNDRVSSEIWDKNCDCFKIPHSHYKPLSGHRY